MLCSYMPVDVLTAKAENAVSDVSMEVFKVLVHTVFLYLLHCIILY